MFIGRVSTHMQSTNIFIGGTVVPTSLDPSLTIWYDASDPTTLSPNANNGTLISQWADKSSVAKNQTPTGGNTKPTVATNYKNGKIALNYKGTDSTDSSTGTALQSLAGTTIFLVFQSTVSGSNQQVIEGTVKSGGNYTAAGYNFAISGSNQYTLGFGGGTATSTASDTKFHIHTIVFDGTQTGNANKLQHRIDGVPQTLTFTANVGSTTSATVSTLVIGFNDAKTNNLTGYLGEFIFYNKTLTAVSIAGTETYLKSKWGIT